MAELVIDIGETLVEKMVRERLAAIEKEAAKADPKQEMVGEEK